MPAYVIVPQGRPDSVLILTPPSISDAEALVILDLAKLAGFGQANTEATRGHISATIRGCLETWVREGRYSASILAETPTARRQDGRPQPDIRAWAE